MHSSISISSGGAERTPWRTLRQAGQVLGGVAAALLLLELLCRVLPVSTSTETGYYIDPLILTYPPGHTFTTAFGWDLERERRQRANNYGFLADHKFTRNPRAVTLIGDSFVEASMLAPGDRLGAQLERRLQGREVYAMGVPGTSLLDYAERIRFASQRFGIHDFVLLLEHGDVAQSLCGSGNNDGPCLDSRTLAPRIEKLPAPGTLKRVLRSSALAQYLFSQLRLDPAGWLHRLAHGAPAGAPLGPHVVSDLPPRAIDTVLRTFFARIRPYRSSCLILVLMGDAPPGDAVRDHLAAAARANGATLIEVGASLRELTARTGLSVYVSPHDHHLNRLALGVIADQVAPLSPR
ncbi:MAG: hypothetical protein ACREUG_06035 [Steroidobacteraceae bacterium]